MLEKRNPLKNQDKKSRKRNQKMFAKLSSFKNNNWKTKEDKQIKDSLQEYAKNAAEIFLRMEKKTKESMRGVDIEISLRIKKKN